MADGQSNIEDLEDDVAIGLEYLTQRNESPMEFWAGLRDRVQAEARRVYRQEMARCGDDRYS